jgi:hypothetical protein
MIKDRILIVIHIALWAVWWRLALRIGTRDPDMPKEAWTNTRPRAEKITDWIVNLDPRYKIEL